MLLWSDHKTITKRVFGMLRNKTLEALVYLKKRDFGAYIKVLAEMGVHVGEVLEKKHGFDKLGTTNEDEKGEKSKGTTGVLMDRFVRLTNENKLNSLFSDADLYFSERELKAKNLSPEDLDELRLKADMFYSSWTHKENPHIPGRPKDTAIDNRSYLIKTTYEKSERQAILLGQAVMMGFLNQYRFKFKDVPLNWDEAESYDDVEDDYSRRNKSKKKERLEKLKVLDDQIYKAIKEHETSRQKIVRYVGKFFAAGMAFAFGGLEGGGAVFLAILGTHPIGWAILLVAALGGLAAAAAGTYINYTMFRSGVPNNLRQIFGKDKFFQGYREYKDPNTGETEILSGWKVAFMGIFTCLLALPTSLAIGAMGYSSTIGLGAKFALLGFGAASTIAFPIAIGFAAIVTIAMTCWLVNTCYKIMTKHRGSVIDFIKQPIRDINEQLDKEFENPTQRRVAKGIAYVTTALLCIGGLVGLYFAAGSGAGSIAQMASQVSQAITGTAFSAHVCTGIGVGLGLVASIVARAPTTVANIGNACVSVVKGVVGWLKNTENRPKFNLWGFVTLVVDVGINEVFYYQSFRHPSYPLPIHQGTSPAAAGTAVGFTGIRDGGMGLDGMFEDDTSVKPSEEKARKHRIKSAVTAAGVDRSQQPVQLNNVADKKASKDNLLSAFSFLIQKSRQKAAPAERIEQSPSDLNDLYRA